MEVQRQTDTADPNGRHDEQMADQHPVLWIPILCFALALTGCGDSQQAPTKVEAPPDIPQFEAPIVFADSLLARAVWTALGKPARPVQAEDLLGLTRLSARGLGIGDLTGIEQLSELTVLDAAHNDITDLTPLSSLRQLIYLDLENNRIVDVSPVRSLPELQFLGLSFNQVVDISPVRFLTKLRSVSLAANPLSEASRTTLLATLEGRGVQISVGVTGFGDVPIQTGPLAFPDSALEVVVRTALRKPLDEHP